MVGIEAGEGVVGGREEGGHSGQGGMGAGVVGREGGRRERDGGGSVCLLY